MPIITYTKNYFITSHIMPKYIADEFPVLFYEQINDFDVRIYIRGRERKHAHKFDNLASAVYYAEVLFPDNSEVTHEWIDN